MKYEKLITLKNGKTLILKNGTFFDGQAMFDVFTKTHVETDFNITYEDEIDFTSDDECKYLKNKEESPDEIEILAFVDGKLVGTAGLTKIDKRFKLRHRAEFGVSIIEEYWGMGIGRCLSEAIIECAKKANYEQLELCVVTSNERAINLYKHLGFEVFGTNPKGFKSKYSGYQDVTLMRLELK